jgi:hypothetical protein
MNIYDDKSKYNYKISLWYMYPYNIEINCINLYQRESKYIQYFWFSYINFHFNNLLTDEKFNVRKTKLFFKKKVKEIISLLVEKLQELFNK